MKKILAVLFAAIGSVFLGGLVIELVWKIPFFAGLYCSLGLASTEGCTQTASTGTEQIITVLIMLISIPLLAAAFSLMTSAHIRKHVNRHTDEKIAEHNQQINDKLDEHHDIIRRMIGESNGQKDTSASSVR
jgi:phosphate/sulfate permease